MALHTTFTAEQLLAHLSARWSWGSASVGNERLLVGNGLGNRSVIGDNAPPFDALRLLMACGQRK